MLKNNRFTNAVEYAYDNPLIYNSNAYRNLEKRLAVEEKQEAERKAREKEAKRLEKEGKGKTIYNPYI